ncbi:hypothetical protein DL98DRAFT_119562 [Cadophora sp. DSE1049]|nr:hypothetical protein DL98DRAFT_119562 [Cadophora sp. DSE1049]
MHNLFNLHCLPRITNLLLLSLGRSLRYETSLLTCLACLFLVYHLWQVRLGLGRVGILWGEFYLVTIGICSFFLSFFLPSSKF